MYGSIRAFGVLYDRDIGRRELEEGMLVILASEKGATQRHCCRVWRRQTGPKQQALCQEPSQQRKRKKMAQNHRNSSFVPFGKFCEMPCHQVLNGRTGSFGCPRSVISTGTGLSLLAHSLPEEHFLWKHSNPPQIGRDHFWNILGYSTLLSWPYAFTCRKLQHEKV